MNPVLWLLAMVVVFTLWAWADRRAKAYRHRCGHERRLWLDYANLAARNAEEFRSR